ncbi:MAG TPA: carbamoyltransferase [Nitrospirae bacterium]|nr:carbamoyltransferase [Nitrospirota bacterium]
MIILGLNAYHGDSSACIVADGRLVAAVEEERFTRVKHWAGLPVQAVRYCLEEAGISIGEVDHIAINRDPRANLLRKLFYVFSKRPSFNAIADRLKNAGRVNNIRDELAAGLEVDASEIKAGVHNVEHHVAHLASSFLVSPFDKAAVVSVDGFGDFVGSMWGMGEGNVLRVRERVFFPHSLGLFYLAFTQYLGFLKYGDEYKVMGLAAYGEPEFMREMKKIVRLYDGNGASANGNLFELGLEYFVHHSEGVSMTWNGGEPRMGPVFSKDVVGLLGPERAESGPIEERHRNIAASLQRMYEEAFFHILDHVYRRTKCPNLALAGGCAMNSLANGRILRDTPFQEVFIQPAAGDAGGAIGAAFYVWNQVLGMPRSYVLENPYLGPGFSDEDISRELAAREDELESAGCRIERIDDEEVLCRRTAEYIADGKVVGWFQGRMEWGARALGNRSIVCDPRRGDMKDILNLKIKRRESFRPFAPSILLEHTGEYFETDYPDPFMLKVYMIKTEKRKTIPAVTHVDGTGRIQTVRRQDNPRYWRLIEEFRRISGVPVVLNTSFNENEPIVCRPGEALDCFLRTRMDLLVLGSFFISR